MDPIRRERDEEATAVNNPLRILDEDRWTSAASGTAIRFENPPIAPQSWKTALDEVATPILREQEEETFNGLANKPVSGEDPAEEYNARANRENPGSDGRHRHATSWRRRTADGIKPDSEIMAIIKIVVVGTIFGHTWLI